MNEERKAGLILTIIALSEGAWCFVNIRSGATRFARYLGFGDPSPRISGWFLALLVTAVFCFYAARLPSVRENLFAMSRLKAISICVAFAAGMCEEAVFRKLLMDAMQRSGHAIGYQILLSALTFGVAHAVWGLMRGSVVAAVRATIVTGALGGALALVYAVSGRNVLPCVAAHLLINALLEPGLVLAAIRGEMSAGRVQ